MKPLLEAEVAFNANKAWSRGQYQIKMSRVDPYLFSQRKRS